MSRGHAFWAMLAIAGILGFSAVSSAAEHSDQTPPADSSAAATDSEAEGQESFYQPFDPASASTATGDSAEAPEDAGMAELPASSPESESAAAAESGSEEPAAGSADPTGFYNSFTPGKQGAGDEAGAGGEETEETESDSAEDAAGSEEAAAAEQTAESEEDASVAQEVPAGEDSGDSWGTAGDACAESPFIGRPEEHVFADQICGICGKYCPDGTGSFIELGYACAGLHGNEDSVDQYGYSPRDWFSNGKLYYGDAYFSRNRFELRWDDVTSEAGRAWGRVSFWPFTIEDDSYILNGRAWDSSGADPLFVEQEVANDDIRLRLHRGEWDSMLLSYREFAVDRSAGSALNDFSLKRMAYQYNFDFGSDVQGQFKQTGTAFDAPEAGFDGAEIDTSQLKLDARLSDELAAYGTVSASAYDYDELPDSEMTSHDYRVGLRYNPDCSWEFSAEFRGRENPDDNTVSSHVESFSEYGLGLSYSSGEGLYEAGYRHRSLDYAKLNMQNAFVFSLLRNSSAVVRPADVAAATTLLTPEYDEAFFNMRQCLSDNLFFTTRVDYSQGDNPGTELTQVGSPSLFYDQRLSRNHGLSYVFDRNNQFDFTVHGAELSNDDRGTDFDENYFEGAWNHAMDDGRMFSLAYRRSEADLDVPTELSGYTTDSRTYIASYSEERDEFGYALRLAVDDGNGAENYRQTSAGADFNLKCLGPVGVKLDWYDRNYRNFPGFDGGAFTVSVAYRLEF